MDGSTASVRFGSPPFPTGSNSEEMPMQDDGTQRIKDLEQGIEQFVTISRWGILQQSLEALGAPPPEFSVIECADFCVKVSIKLSLSNLTSINGECINHSVIEGQTCYSYANAQDTAISKAMKYLESNYMIKIYDFSSRVTSVLESSNMQGLLEEGICSLEHLFAQWDLLFVKVQEFTKVMQRKKLSDYFGGPLSPNGIVYAVVSDYLDSIESGLIEKAEELCDKFDEVKSDRLKLLDKLQTNEDQAKPVGSYSEVTLPAKLLLELVLSFYGLQNAEYISTPHPLGTVKSEAKFKFPYLNDFQYGGQLTIAGFDYSSVEAEEEAAYQSLLFIEKNFRTHILDYNHTKCKKTRKAQNKFISMIQSTFEIGVGVRMMFGDLVNSIKCQVEQFSFNSSSLFLGPMGLGQIEAYELCRKGINDVDTHATECFSTFEQHFVTLQQIGWKLTEAKTNLPI